MKNMKINLVKYLDRTGDLQIIENNALKHKKECFYENTNKYSLPLKVSLCLDYLLLVEIAGEFASLFIEEPHIAKNVLSDFIRTCCMILTDWEHITVHLLIRLIAFPDQLVTTEYKSIHYGGLFTRNGILAEISSIEKYVQDTSFKCKYSTCHRKGKIFKINGKCDCGEELIEVACSRLSGEKVIGLLFDPEFLQPLNGYSRTQGIYVEFRDEMFVGLEIGIRYNIALTFAKGIHLAWGVQPMLPDPLVRAISNISLPPLPSAVSKLILDIKERTYASPWAMVSALSSVIPCDAYPLSAFLHLKTALLLSLASICSKSPIPILALGDCATLMMDSWYCSPRAVFSPSEPASLLVASYGVCLVNEINSGMSYITTAVESELVTIKSSKDKRHSTYSLKAAIWMYWNCNKHSGQDVHKLRTLIDIFGIPFLDNVDVNDEEISAHILQKTIDSSFSANIISQKDFRKFIDIISGMKVTMSEMASALIRNYFVASRRERPECLPLKAIKVLTSLSESHAKISLRDTVTYEDAVAAIFLYEESISVLFGPSVCSVLPKRTITENNPIEIARQMDVVLGRFSEWLQSYTRHETSIFSENRDDSYHLSTSPPNFL